MDNGAKCDIQLLFQQRVPELHDVLASIRTSTSLCTDHHKKLIWLSKELNIVNKEVKWLFSAPAERSQILNFLDLLAAQKVAYYQLIETVNLVEPSLSRLLDLIELQMTEPGYRGEFNGYFDRIEGCISLSAELKVRLSDEMALLEASLEFDEISKDHMNSLAAIIDKNIELCLEVQEDRFASPVRHPPSFTLKQLIRLLASQTDTTEIKIPTFSPLEETLCRKYLEIRGSVTPIEKSLKEVLPARIMYFGQRKIVHIDYLTDLLKRKYKEILMKYKLMLKEVCELKSELVDKRWNTLFLNLNHELSSILNEVESLQAKILEYSYNTEMQQKIKYQLDNKSKTVTKTFDVIYKALEFSLLNADIASQTNKLAQKWLDVRPRSDGLLDISSPSVDENSLDSLSSHFRSFSVGSSETSDTELSAATVPSRGKFGALLLKKMNIKPVIVTSPTSRNGNNPFFCATSERKEKNALILNPVPLLPFVKRNPSIEDENQSDTPTAITTPCSIEKLEAEKIKFYSTRPTHIPKAQLRAVSAAGWRKPRPQSPWTPYAQTEARIKLPTPLSEILTTKSRST